MHQQTLLATAGGPSSTAPLGRTLTLPAWLASWGLTDVLERALPHTVRHDDNRLDVDLHRSRHTLPTLAHYLLPHGDLVDRLHPDLRRVLLPAVAVEARHRNDSDAMRPRTADRWADRLPPAAADTLRGYQRASIDYIERVADGRGFLGGDPGAGKTLASLSIVTVRDALPAVILCKPSLTGNWQDEIATWLGTDDHVAVLSGQSNDPAQIPDGTRFVICSYAIAAHRLDQLLTFAPKALIADESQYLKTAPHGDGWLAWHAAKAAADAGDTTIEVPREPKAEKGSWRTWAARQLSRSPGLDTVLLLTATPAPNGRHVEYLPQLDILGVLDEFGGADRFVARYCRWCYVCWADAGKPKRMPPIASCEHPTKPEKKIGKRRVPNDQASINTVELARRLRATVMTRHTQRQMYPHLPPIVPVKQLLPLSAAGRREYRRVEDEFLEYLRDHVAKKAANEGLSVGQAVARALNSAQGDHEQLVKVAHLRQAAARAKMPALLEWLADRAGQNADGQPNKMVLFAWHRDIQHELLEAVNGLLAKKPWADMLADVYPDGYPGVPAILSASDTNAAQIRENKRRFQTIDAEPFIVCSIAAAAEGHTLDAAYTVAMAELPPNYAMLRQAVGRAYGRSSNPHGATLVSLIADQTIELDVDDAIDGKKLAQVMTLDQGVDIEWGEHQIVEFESDVQADAAFIDGLWARRTT